MAMRVSRLRKLGIPKESRDPFALMCEHKLISLDLQNKMFGLVGFRNTVVHNYKKLDVTIVEVIIQKHLQDFRDFSAICLRLS
jgi:uncharacterized protein YutE (UPF0331/DUF86 family)